MNIFTVAFFGHRIIDNPFPVEQKLEKIIRELLHNKRRGCGVGRSNSRHLARTIVPASPIQSRRPCSAGQLAGAPWHQ